MTNIYFNGRDGKPIRKGDKVMWDGNKETIWIIMSDPCGLTIYDGTHPDSDYMDVWAKPSDDPSETYNSKWVRRKTKGFTKIQE